MFEQLTDDSHSLKRWLLKQKFKKWIYPPLDSSGPHDKLTFPLGKAILGFDRIITYTQFGEDLIRRTIGDKESDTRHLCNLPHGIDSSVFFETNRNLSRRLFFQHTKGETGKMMLGLTKIPDPIMDDEVLIGIVATNQPRKDWSLGIETAALLAKDRKVRLWCHTDILERNWSIPSLLADYGILYNAIISSEEITNANMAHVYSACDLTLGIGLGEGMGYPIFESLFCGTPCIHGDSGGAPEYMAQRCQGQRVFDEDEPLLVKPIAFRYEGSFSCLRPVFRAEDWASKASAVIGKRMNHCGELDWDNLWPRWEAWFREAVK
jgi:glycosyltransferase involved in cell wall biosynthesis